MQLCFFALGGLNWLPIFFVYFILVNIFVHLLKINTYL